MLASLLTVEARLVPNETFGRAIRRSCPFRAELAPLKPRFNVGVKQLPLVPLGFLRSGEQSLSGGGC